ncbi:MAG: hypothetical protein GQ525_00595 [Draconibacterium sp.]|nr:hypothetical protein [Draconibacterium sp.]
MVDIKKIGICIFIHYSVSNSLPYYVQIYINELSLYFDKVKVLTNNSEIHGENYSLNNNISFEYLENQGYDFGMFYRFIINKDLNKFSEIAVVNDSNILINKLDAVFNWAKENGSDFWGVIDSNEKPWFSTHDNNYHIQSHFLVFNQKAIKKLHSFLNLIDVKNIMDEKNTKQLRRLVIDKWEIGLSQYLISQGLKPDSFIRGDAIMKKFKPKKMNLTHSLYHELIKEGYPFMKRKVASNKKKLFRTNNTAWKKIIMQYGNNDWDLTKIIEENS